MPGTISPRLTSTTLGSLSCTCVQSDDRPPAMLVVLCHGFGAPGDDLVGLGPELLQRRPELQGKVRFLFPEAPLSLGFAGYGEARAWWLIDMDRLVAAQGDPAGAARLRAEVPEGLPRARRLLRGLVDAACQQTSLPPGRVVLGGFSQGGMLATDVALRLEEAPAGLCVLSGTLLCEPEWRRLAPARRGLPVLQSHGRQDPLLPFEHAEALRDLFQEAGLGVEFLPFDGQHTIPLAGMERLGDFLVRRLQGT
jgi:phospholipase/carboxylesterase